MARAPIRKTAARTRARAASALRLSKYTADAAHTSAAITHQLGGRHRYFPAQRPAAKDKAAHSKGCRVLLFAMLVELEEFKKNGNPFGPKTLRVKADHRHG